MKTACLLTLLIATTTTSFADTPSYFRKDSGVAAEGALPAGGVDLSTPTWKQSLLPGNSSPCVAGDLVFLTTWDEKRKQLTTVGLNRSTGKIKWRHPVPTRTIESFHPVGSPASCTVACDGKRVYSFFGSYGLMCFSLDGALLWSRQMGPFQDEFGASSSPILVDGKVILNEDHDVDNFITAIDAASGGTVWTTKRPGFTRSYSTPVVWEVNGKKQIVVAGSLQLVAYDPADGKRVWWVNGLSRNVDTKPAIDGDTLYLATWTPGGDQSERIAMEPFEEALKQYDKNNDQEIAKTELTPGPVLTRFFRIDLNQNEKLDAKEWAAHARVFELAQNVAMAVKAGGKGDVTDTHVRWLQRRNLPTVPSPLVYDGNMYMVKNGGILTTLNTRDGVILKQGRLEGRGNYYASLVGGGGFVYSASEQGVVTVVRAGGDDWEVFSSHDFKSRIMATPVIADGQLFIRTDDALYCYGK